MSEYQKSSKTFRSKELAEEVAYWTELITGDQCAAERTFTSTGQMAWVVERYEPGGKELDV